MTLSVGTIPRAGRQAGAARRAGGRLCLALGSCRPVQLAGQGIRVAGLHVGYMDTNMVRTVTAPKSDPAGIARIAVDGIAAGAYEILADNGARQAQAALAAGVSALYPQLP